MVAVMLAMSAIHAGVPVTVLSGFFDAGVEGRSSLASPWPVRMGMALGGEA